MPVHRVAAERCRSIDYGSPQLTGLKQSSASAVGVATTSGWQRRRVPGDQFIKLPVQHSYRRLPGLSASREPSVHDEQQTISLVFGRSRRVNGDKAKWAVVEPVADKRRVFVPGVARLRKRVVQVPGIESPELERIFEPRPLVSLPVRYCQNH